MRRLRKAGVVITASPTQLVERTSIFSGFSGKGYIIFCLSAQMPLAERGQMLARKGNGIIQGERGFVVGAGLFKFAKLLLVQSQIGVINSRRRVECHGPLKMCCSLAVAAQFEQAYPHGVVYVWPLFIIA